MRDPGNKLTLQPAAAADPKREVSRMETGVRLLLAALQLSSMLGLAACGRQASRPTPEYSANSIVAQATADNDQASQMKAWLYHNTNQSYT